MHEFGIASEIWQSVRRSAERHGGGRVLSITMELGELNLIEDEQLRFWVTALAERDGSPGVELRISHVPAQVRCRQCGEETAAPLGDRRAGPFLAPRVACAGCGSVEVELTGGREIRVVSAEIES